MWKRPDESRRRAQPAQVSERVDSEVNREKVRDEETLRLADQLERVATHLERANFGEYVKLLHRPGRLIFLNLIGGIARGLGVAIGFTIVAAMVLYLLQELVLLQLPIIGDFIAQIVKIVEAQLYTPNF